MVSLVWRGGGGGGAPLLLRCTALLTLPCLAGASKRSGGAPAGQLSAALPALLFEGPARTWGMGAASTAADVQACGAGGCQGVWGVWRRMGGEGCPWPSLPTPHQRPTVPPPPCDMPSGCSFFTGPWTITRSSLRMLRRVAAFCRPLRPVLRLVSFPRSQSPVVGVLGLC